MSRLTDKKVLANFKAIKNISPDYVASNEELIYAKLGELEDLEEQLGCPLEVMVKLLKNHMYYAEKPNHKGKLYEMNFPHISFVIKGGNAGGMEYKDNSFIVGGTCYDFYNMKRQEFDGWDVHLKDYKKTWWLKEDKN